MGEAIISRKGSAAPPSGKYAWKISTPTLTPTASGGSAYLVFNALDATPVTTYTSTDIKLNNDGSVSLVNPRQVTLTYSNYYSVSLDNYFVSPSNPTSNIQPSTAYRYERRERNDNNYISYYGGPLQVTAGETLGFVIDNASNAFPYNGMKDGKLYTPCT